MQLLVIVTTKTQTLFRRTTCKISLSYYKVCFYIILTHLQKQTTKRTTKKTKTATIGTAMYNTILSTVFEEPDREENIQDKPLILGKRILSVLMLRLYILYVVLSMSTIISTHPELQRKICEIKSSNSVTLCTCFPFSWMNC